MIIGVDAAVLAVIDKRLKVGVYHFAVNLLESLTKIDKKNKYLLYSFDPIPKSLLNKFDANWTNLVLKPRRGWLNFRLSLEFLLHKPDVFLGLSQALPLYHPERSIVFVHDLAFELFPDYYKGSYHRISCQTKFAAKFTKKLIAVSESTKDDLIKLYKIKPEKVEVIYHGVDKRFKAARVRPLGLLRSDPNQYFLFVGSYKPIKNIPNIIKAFNLFIKEVKKPYRLILAGSDFWMDREISKTIKNLRLDKFVKLIGFVAEADLPILYRNAYVFISPSFYEGFGMPILEAMASGVPVISSNRGSIPEIVGEGALLVDPDDIIGIKNALVKLISDKRLREQIREKGLEKAKQYKWEKSARKLLDVIYNP